MGSSFKGNLWCGLSDLCMSHWLSSYSPLTWSFSFSGLPHFLSHMHTCFYRFLFIFWLKRNWPVSWKHVRRVWRDDESERYLVSQSYHSLKFKLPLIHTHPSPSPFSPPLFSPPSSSLWWHIYVLMETRCALLQRRRQERERPSMRLYDTSLTDCRKCGVGGGEDGSCCFSLVVLRVQTVTVCRCQMKCALYPDQALSKAGGVSLRIWLGHDEGSWAWRTWISISYDGSVFCRAWETMPYETGLKKSNLKKLECWLFNFLAPVFFLPTQYLPLTFKRDCSRSTTPNSKCRHCVKCNKRRQIALNW